MREKKVRSAPARRIAVTFCVALVCDQGGDVERGHRLAGDCSARVEEENEPVSASRVANKRAQGEWLGRIENARIGKAKNEPRQPVLGCVGLDYSVAGVSRSENRIGASSPET
jgi:hypothetical protein